MRFSIYTGLWLIFEGGVWRSGIFEGMVCIAVEWDMIMYGRGVIG